jgi:nucleoside-diphosphate-sugar epimerase
MTFIPSVALVTGATGFVGGHLTQRLVDEGWRVKVLVRDVVRLAAPLQGKVETVVGDLADGEVLRCAVREVSVVFHCAANVNTWDSRDAYVAVNVNGVRNLLDAIAAANPALSRLVHVSTVDVYGYPESPCDERCPTGGAGFGYGESKLVGETLVREFCAARGIPCVVLRPCNVIGPGSQFIAQIGAALTSGLMLKVGGGRANAGMLYVGNLVDYLLWAARAERAVGECYNVRDGYDVSWMEFIDALRSSIDGRGRVIDLPFALADAVAHVLEAFHRVFLPAREPLLHRLIVRMFGRTCGHGAEKIRTDSGIESRVGFDEAMQRSAQWFLEKAASK